MNPVLATLAALIAVASPPRGTVVYAGGGWAAVERAGVCEAATRALLIAPKGRTQAVASFAFTRDRRRWGEFHARLSRQPRPGSTVIAAIGGQQFLLVSRGGDAWSRGALQEQGLIAAARSGGAMRIDARDAAGRRFTDRYMLDGAATAIDAAAARCAGKMTPL